MARPLRWLLTFVVLLTAGMVNAQVPTEIKGTWLVEVNDNNRPRTMVVTEEQNAVRVLFGFAGEKLSTIPAKLTDRGELTATTLFGSVMVLNSKGADRLEGSFTPKTGKVFVAQASRTNASETVSAVAVPTAKAAATPSLSQEANATLASEKGFDLSAVCDSSRASSKLTFREEADHYAVAIDNLSRGSCKSEARGTSPTTFTFNGCRDTNIVMTFDPADKTTPFTSKSAACSYVFKPR